MTPDGLRTPDDVSAYADWLFGRSFEPRPGLVHVVSVESKDDTFFVMRIRGDTPRNPHDACMLRMARARSDAIITTGKVLREEPDLRHDLSGSGADAALLRSWGDGARGRSAERVSIVLTGGTAFAPDHPLLRGRTNVVIACPSASANALRARFAGCGADVVGLEQLTLSAAVRVAERDWGAKTVLVEAGPATARLLYEDGDGPNELMLAEYSGKITPEVRGGRLTDRPTVVDVMGAPHFGPTLASNDGRWRFAWLERRPSPHAP